MAKNLTKIYNRTNFFNTQDFNILPEKEKFLICVGSICFREIPTMFAFDCNSFIS